MLKNIWAIGAAVVGTIATIGAVVALKTVEAGERRDAEGETEYKTETLFESIDSEMQRAIDEKIKKCNVSDKDLVEEIRKDIIAKARKRCKIIGSILLVLGITLVCSVVVFKILDVLKVTKLIC